MPCPPSRLLYTYTNSGISDDTRNFVRAELEKAELCIKRRSLAIENNWCIDKLKQPIIGQNHIKVLEILDVLDKHCYDLADVGETVDKLYKKIFPPITIFMSRAQVKEAADLVVENSDRNGKDLFLGTLPILNLKIWKFGDQREDFPQESLHHTLGDSSRCLFDLNLSFLSTVDWELCL